MSGDPRDAPLIQRLTLQEIDSGRTFNAEIGWRWANIDVIDLDGGKVPELSNLCYSVDRTMTVEGEELLERPVTLRLEPVDVKTGFGYTESEVEEDMYPPSAKGTYGRLMKSDIVVRRILQREVESNTHWLYLLSEADSRPIHHHPVFDYEVFFHGYKNQTALMDRSPKKLIDDKRRHKIWNSLEEAKAPSWKDLYKLTKGYDKEDLTLGRNMRDTVDQFIPTDWPSDIRGMYNRGLCAILSPDLLKTDPLDIVDAFIDSATAHVTTLYHYINLVRGSTTSDIVRIINSPRLHTKVTSEGQVPLKWSLPLREIETRMNAPQSQPTLIHHSLKLTTEQSTKPRFPVTWEKARQSRKKWNERVILIAHFLTMTGRYNPERVGLRSLLYLGGAYRWPHKHSTWMTEAVSGDRKLQIQELLLPPQAVEKVTRFLERVLVTRWYSRRVNYHTYDSKSGDWLYDPVKMARQVGRKASMKRIIRDFNIGPPNLVTVPDRKDAVIMDSLGRSIRYQDFERNPGLWDVLDMTPEEFESRLKSLVNEGVVTLSYQFHPPRYTTRCLVLQGDMSHIRSLAYALLENAPTCSVYLFDSSAFIILSLHPEKMGPFIETLVSRAIENDVLVEPWTVNRYYGYRWGLLQRIMREDGTWDDDISGLLSQGRGLGLPLGKDST